MQNREDNLRCDEIATAQRVDGLLMGTITALNGLGEPTVNYLGATVPHEAKTTVTLHGHHVGRKAVLAFEDGRLDSPIVIGVLHDPLVDLIEVQSKEGTAREADIDDERVVLTADKEIVLKCGDASITLRKDGKVLIRGTHLLSRSSGPNRVKGASVQIN